VLGDCLGVVDLDQHGAGRDVLPALDRDLADPAIDPGRDVEPGRIHLALHQQGFGPHEVPNR